MSQNLFESLHAVSYDLQALGVGKSDKIYANYIKFFEYGDDLSILDSAQVVLIGAQDSDIDNSSILYNVRVSLYKLYHHGNDLNIVDLGDIPGTGCDTILEQIISYLSGTNTFIIVLGSNPDKIKSVYLGVEPYSKKVSVSCVSPSVDMCENDTSNYLSQLFEYRKHKLFDLNILGYQLYLSNHVCIEKMSDSYYQTVRLGVLRNDILSAEPFLRDSDIVLFDMASVRGSDLSQGCEVGPNGLYAEELCQLARYAGISDNLKTAVIAWGDDWVEEFCGQTSQLIGQVVWHLIEGFQHRKNEDLLNNVNTVKKIIVTLDSPSRQFYFYHSDISERWWMEIPDDQDVQGMIFACSVDDYRTACNHEVPLRWVLYHQKMLNQMDKY